MNAIIKNLLLLIVVMAVGLLVGHGAQRAYAHFQSRAEAIQTGDFSSLIRQSKAPVVLFSTQTCPYCKLAKAYLEKHRIAYRNIDVSTREGEVLFAQYQGEGVPLLMTASVRLQGYMEPEYDTYLKALTRG